MTGIRVAALTAAMLAAAPASAEPGAAKVLFDPADGIDGWRRYSYEGETAYAPAVLAGRPAIRALALGSSSLLVRPVTLDLGRCPVIEWSWSAIRIQAGADLRVKEGDDTAASLYLLFGDPQSLLGWLTVTTLRYVWTNDRLPAETVVVSPYLPATVRSVVVESGDARAGAWVEESRDAAKDFERAFGRRPEGPVRAIALLTDSDQTGEPAEAYFGGVRAACEN